MEQTTRDDFSGFYVMSSIGKRKSLTLRRVRSYVDAWEVTCNKTVPPIPVEFKFTTKNPTLTDFATTVIWRIVSKKVLDILKNVHVTGWSSFPVSIYNKQGDVVGGYSGLSITGSCGGMLKSKARIEKKAMPGGVFDKKVGLYFDPKTWDGSDMFCPEGTAIVIVTEKVKKALEAAKVTNVEFTNVHDYEHSM